MTERAKRTLAGDSHAASEKVAANNKNLAKNAKFPAKLGRKLTPLGKALRSVCDAAGCTYSHAMRCYYGERTGSPETMKIIGNVMRAAGLPERGVRSSQA